MADFSDPVKSGVLQMYLRHPYPNYSAEERAQILPAELCRYRYLGLEPFLKNARVLDVGCGTGLSFGLLEAAIGPAGRIIAIEQSPDMMDVARRRVADNGWDNIKLIQACAEEASWRGQADALLMHFTHDIVRCQRTLDHLLGHLKPGATVVSTGLKWAPPWCVPVNLYVLSAALYSVSSLEGLAEPWTLLTQALEDVQLEEAIWGGGYVASGRYAPPATR